MQSIQLKSDYILLALLIVCYGDANAQSLNSRASDDLARHGVLIIDAPPEFRAQGCQKLLVWDDAAITYYSGRGVPSEYCKLNPGLKSIPIFEETRRKRGLPPGSYTGLRQEINRIDADLKKKKEEARRLKEEIERDKKAIAQDPEYKRAMESIDSLFEYNIFGVRCTSDYSALIECSRGKYSSPVSREKCLEYLKNKGYEDPCPALGRHR